MTDKKKIETLIQEELKSANEKYPLFHSPHEAFAVLKEEVEEANEEFADIFTSLFKMWSNVRNDIPLKDNASKIYNIAINAACEAIQVAAMAQKMLYGEEHNYETCKNL